MFPGQKWRKCMHEYSGKDYCKMQKHFMTWEAIKKKTVHTETRLRGSCSAEGMAFYQILKV